MKRKIIHIDEEKCNGCGACVTACHEGAIDLIDGKAKLVREHYCDGLGDCLPTCPTGAITFEEREALAYDEAAVMESKRQRQQEQETPVQAGCPGSAMRQLQREGQGCPGTAVHKLSGGDSTQAQSAPAITSQGSELRQWPVQIKLAPVNAPYFQGAKLLIAADCTAFSYGAFHQDFIRGHITLVGCPKLDDIDYSEKLTEIIRKNDIKSVHIVRMEVPCCGGLEMAAKRALQDSGKFIPWQVTTISIDGKILD